MRSASPSSTTLTGTTGSCSYFLLFSRPFSGADRLCGLVSQQAGLTCLGELLAPKTKAAQAARSRTGFNFTTVRAEPSDFLRATTTASVCQGALCGAVVMPFQLPSSALPRLFAPRCSVRSLVLERSNRTAEYAEFRRKSAGAAGSDHAAQWASMSASRFSALHDEWFRLVFRTAGAPSFYLTTEELLEASAADAAPPPAPVDAASSTDTLLPALYAFLRASDAAAAAKLARASATWQPSAVPALSVAGAKAASHSRDDRAASHRELRRRAVLYTASAAFASTCLAGCCFALGIAFARRFGHVDLPRVYHTHAVDGRAGHGERFRARDRIDSAEDEHHLITPGSTEARLLARTPATDAAAAYC